MTRGDAFSWFCIKKICARFPCAPSPLAQGNLARKEGAQGVKKRALRTISESAQIEKI
jgi:hypothetical protein